MNLPPEITEILISLFLALLGYVAIRVERMLKEKTGIEIEAKHREALKAALNTGARIAAGRVASHINPADAGKFKAAEEALRREMFDIVREHIRASVPDALKALRPDQEVIGNLIESAVIAAEQEIKGQGAHPQAHTVPSSFR